MSLVLRASDEFVQDFALQSLWYVREAGKEVARQFERGVDRRLKTLSEQPSLGRPRRFRDPRLYQLRSIALERPFHRFLIFYRNDGEILQALRLIEGSPDLPRRLAEPPL